MSRQTTLADAEHRHALHYHSVIQRLDRAYYDGGVFTISALQEFDDEREQMVKGFRWCERERHMSDEVARLFVGYILDGSQILTIRTPPRSRLADLVRARVICHRLEDRRRESIALRHQGSALLDLGDRRRAKRSYERVLSLVPEDDDATRAAVFCCFGRLHANAHEVAEAVSYSERALALHEKLGDSRGRSIALSNLARAFTAAADYDKAIEFAESELHITRDLKDRHGEADALGGLANAHAGRGDVETALQYYGQSIAICREIRDRQGESNELFNSSLVLWKLGKQQEAFTAAKAALKLYEELESSYISEARGFLEEMQIACGNGHPA